MFHSVPFLRTDATCVAAKVVVGNENWGMEERRRVRDPVETSTLKIEIRQDAPGPVHQQQDGTRLRSLALPRAKSNNNGRQGWEALISNVVRLADPDRSRKVKKKKEETPHKINGRGGTKKRRPSTMKTRKKNVGEERVKRERGANLIRS